MQKRCKGTDNAVLLHLTVCQILNGKHPLLDRFQPAQRECFYLPKQPVLPGHPFRIFPVSDPYGIRHFSLALPLNHFWMDSGCSLKKAFSPCQSGKTSSHRTCPSFFPDPLFGKRAFRVSVFPVFCCFLNRNHPHPSDSSCGEMSASGCSGFYFPRFRLQLMNRPSYFDPGFYPGSVWLRFWISHPYRHSPGFSAWNPSCPGWSEMHSSCRT